MTPLPQERTKRCLKTTSKRVLIATMSTDKRKQSLYFPEMMLEEIRAEANRQDRSLSWIVQRTWALARKRVHSFPAVNDNSDSLEDPRGRDE